MLFLALFWNQHHSTIPYGIFSAILLLKIIFLKTILQLFNEKTVRFSGFNLKRYG
jgi:hypothetical protein